MRKLAICLCAAVALLGCSHNDASVVGTWKSKKNVVVFDSNNSWNIVGVMMDSGTWLQVGTTVTITPSKIKGETRDEYTATLKKSGGDQLVGQQKIDKAFDQVTLILSADGQTLKDSSGKLGDMARQKS